MGDAEQDVTPDKSPFAWLFFTFKLLTGGFNCYQQPLTELEPPHNTPWDMAFVTLRLLGTKKGRAAFAAVVSLAGRIFSAAAIKAVIGTGRTP